MLNSCTTLRAALALAILSVSTPAWAKTAPPAWPGGDPHVRAQDDLFQHANGGWLKQTAIPADKRAFGTFLALRERSDAEVRKLLDDAMAHPGADADAKLLHDYYGSLMNLTAIEKAGLAPLHDRLAAIDDDATLDDVAVSLARLGQMGVSTPVGMYVSPDAKNPRVNAIHWVQYGLGLPDREDYLDDSPAAQKRREAYQIYLKTLFTLNSARDPEIEAKRVFDFETALAKIQWKSADRRDSVKTYNPTPSSAWETEFPGFPWQRWSAASGVPEHATVAIISEKSYMPAFAKLAAETDLGTWKAYMKAHLLDAYADNLPTLFRRASHQFHGVAMSGLAAAPPRWQTAVKETNSMVGEAIAKRFVAVHFPPAAKARMKVLVGNLIGAYRDRLAKLDWMTPATRAAARTKLDKMVVKIGYPDKWRGFKGLDIRDGDAVGNAMRTALFESQRDMAEVGQPVDRSRWHMHPQVVNAYYSPVGNEIVFPAAILRPPFFDLNGDDAYNYGAIGAVIGHEISHGFDDQGRRYDADGRLRDWWSPQDEKAFTARASMLISQYGKYEPLPGQKVDGKLTLGENIADLAGVAMALRAYDRSLGGKKGHVIDGRTPEQRFFYGYSRVWRSKSRPEWLRTRLISDSHSPEQYRVNGVVTNIDAFYDAFDLKAGDKLYQVPAERVRIW